MEGESRELSNAGVVRQRVGCDGAQGQGLAPGVWAGGDIIQALISSTACSLSSIPPLRE